MLVLFQHDAACRVIARLKKERDEARSLLAQAERQVPMSTFTAVTANLPALTNGKRGSCFITGCLLYFSSKFSCWLIRSFFLFLHYIAAPEDEEMGPDGKKVRLGISQDIIAELSECNAKLSQQRKKRQVS